MKKNKINLFGENSISHVEKKGLLYAVIRDCDNVILARSFRFKKYMNDTIRTMYTGKKYGTGDFLLIADTVNGQKEIYRWQ